MSTLRHTQDHHGELSKDLTFRRIFSHVSAHQDEIKEWNELSRAEQLNCSCDLAAKRAITQTVVDGVTLEQNPLPLEPVAFFVGKHKVTTEAGSLIRYAAHYQEAKDLFDQQNIVERDNFDLIDWEPLHKVLSNVPKMFQIFLCKQVFGVLATNRYLHKRGASPVGSATCQSCTLHDESAAHILLCPEEGRVLILNKLADQLLDWLDDYGTPRDLTYLIVSYIKGRGERSMTDICRNLPDIYKRAATTQDRVGWRRFLEGMISVEFRQIVEEIGLRDNPSATPLKWCKDLILKLQEITHGMWIYRNLSIHDSSKGVLAVQRREKLLEEIEKQIQLGGEGLDEKDEWMLEVNLGDLEEGSTGEYETYWLLAIETARERYRLAQQTVEREVRRRGP